MRLIILLLLVVPSFNSSAVIYSQYEIDELMNSSDTKQSSKSFIRGFFTAKDTVQYIEHHLQQSKNNGTAVILEYRLYQLLNEISYQTKQGFLQKFVTQMKTYQPQAFKIHDEGRVPVAIYNINARAKGIENIWLADDSFAYYERAFAKNSMTTLLDLKKNLKTLKQPEWLGLKKSIQTISQDNHNLISDYLLEGSANLIGLNKFVSHYALFTANQELVHVALHNLDKNNSEYLLRNLKNHFEKFFVIKQLIDAVESNNNAAFAVSLMLEYINEIEVERKLFSLLADDKYSKQAAMVLAQTDNGKAIQNLETLFFESDSLQVKKQIIFVLKMNQKAGSAAALERVSRTLKNESKTNKWLSSFKGEFE